ncbi:hypothetical protein [Comamonas terrigena]|uniref:hypothetical protein n=1 Tax=Comamonas terrigena TaxID=32013 RepID=UPI0024482325|nr:hypothetical protein [Comamonas terrigena]MDH1701838.1 hypothetical protein [Comamonas terrigena]
MHRSSYVDLPGIFCSFARSGGRPFEYVIHESLTISDSLLGLDAALEGVGLAHTFEQLAEPHMRAKRLKRVLATFSPAFPGFYLYCPTRRDQPLELKAMLEHIGRTIPRR